MNDKSIMRLNAEKDADYCPWCLRCAQMVRMKKVEPFLWRCRCGAVHDERGQQDCNYEHSGILCLKCGWVNPKPNDVTV
jgi:hypothetical protein